MPRSQIQPGATLIATLGTEPQVVTAAVDLLSRQGERLCGVVVLHTTAPGTPIASAVEKLRDEFAIGSPPLTLVALHDEAGRPLQDVETPLELAEMLSLSPRTVEQHLRKCPIPFRLCLPALPGSTGGARGTLGGRLVFDGSKKEAAWKNVY